MIDIPGVGLDQDGMRPDCMAQNGVKLITVMSEFFHLIFLVSLMLSMYN